MLNTRELEKKWLAYKIKSYIPHAIIISAILTIAIFVNMIKEAKTTQEKEIVAIINATDVKKDKIEVKQVPEQISTPKPKKIEVIEEYVAKQEQTAIEQYEELKLKPSLSFMKKIQSSNFPYYQEEVGSKKTNAKKTNKQKEKTLDIAILETPTVESSALTKINNDEELTDNRIVIDRHNAKDDINTIIKRFKKNNNPALSLFIAKKYYELGDYHNSYNYALITNQINNSIEDSWIVFSKSLVKLDKKDMAIKTLKDYIKDSYSNNAKILLDDIQSGKFK